MYSDDVNSIRCPRLQFFPQEPVRDGGVLVGALFSSCSERGSSALDHYILIPLREKMYKFIFFPTLPFLATTTTSSWGVAIVLLLFPTVLLAEDGNRFLQGGRQVRELGTKSADVSARKAEKGSETSELQLTSRELFAHGNLGGLASSIGRQVSTRRSRFSSKVWLGRPFELNPIGRLKVCFSSGRHDGDGAMFPNIILLFIWWSCARRGCNSCPRVEKNPQSKNQFP